MRKDSHAYIFAGAKGLGKRRAAFDMANELTCSNVADITEVTNEHYQIKTKSGKLSVDAVRAARNDAYIRPYSEKKVFIIDRSDEMNAECQNALLKVLEEPPSYCVFILIAENDSKLLPTIRSRAITKRFAPVGEDELLSLLSRQHPDIDCSLAASLASGSPGLAEELLKEEDLKDIYKKTVSALKGLTLSSSRNLYKAIAFFESESSRRELLFIISSAVFQKILLSKTQNHVKIEFEVPQKAAIYFLEELEKVRLQVQQNGSYTMLITCLLTGSWEAFHGRYSRNKI